MVVHFVAVAVALFDFVAAVDFGGQAAGFQFHFLRAQAHGAAQIGAGIADFHAAVGRLPFINQAHHGIRRFEVEFGGIGIFQAGHIACIFNQGDLHAQADAQIGNVIFARIFHGGDFAFHTAHAEAAGHQNGVFVCQAFDAFFFDGFAVDIGDLHVGVGVDAGVFQGFGE